PRRSSEFAVLRDQRLREPRFALVRADVLRLLRVGFLRVVVRFTRSGSLVRPVSRFHSSKVSGDIFPFTSSSANLRRCALLLNGIGLAACLYQFAVEPLLLS